MRIIITGAGGQLGRLVTERLLQRHPGRDLILVTRQPEAISGLADRGASVRFGDFDEPDTLDEAFRGGERLLLISTMSLGRRVDQHRAAILAARRARVGRIVYTSMINPVPDHPIGLWVDEHRQTEDALRDAELAWTVLRNGYYAESLVDDLLVAFRSGRLVTNHGGGRVAFVSRADCAAVAAETLLDDRHAGNIYDVTGPAALDMRAVAAIGAQLSGRPIEAIEIDDAAAAGGLVEAGLAEPLVRFVVSLGVAVRNGYYAQVSTTVRDLTGREASPLRDVLAREFALAAEARPTG